MPRIFATVGQAGSFSLWNDFKVENAHSSLDQFVGMAAAIAQILAVEGGVEPSGEQVVEVGVIGTRDARRWR